MAIWIGLTLSLASAVAVNWAYTREHDAATKLPHISIRNPLRSARTLAASRSWLEGFAAETGGWLLYVAALRLAPLALVQTVGGAGLAVLAVVESRGRLDRLPRRKQFATAVVVCGLVLLGLSLSGHNAVGRQPGLAATILWLGASAGGAIVLTLAQISLSRVVALGLAAGLFFGVGDISAKLAVHGGLSLLAIVPLIVAYALGSIELQAAFQRGDALTAAGMATLATNALPIAAGVVLFRERVPHGVRGIQQIVAFGTLVAGAILLNDRLDRAEPSPRSGSRA